MTDAETAKSSSRLLLIVLSIVAVVALGFVVAVWIVVKPIKDTLWFEVAKASLQVFVVAVIGGIVGLVTFKYQQDRQNADKEADRALERQREEFDRRATLLDRTSRCAQKMYVTCQHVRR